MKRNLAAGLLTALLVPMHPAPADACGVKLTVKSSAPRKAVARTSNPSDILLLGNPPHRLESDLAAAGHRVEVAPSASAAKRKTYAVVITDANLQDEARSSFQGATVVVRSGDVAADMRAVEQQVARKPVRTEERPVLVRAPDPRKPIAAGPQPDERKLVNASPPKEPAPEPTPPPPATPPPAERVATAQPTRPAEPKVTEVTPPAAEARTAPRTGPGPRATVAKAGTVHDEVYFALGSSQLSQAALNKAVRWLTDASEVHVVVEGHADPTGTHEGNMVLSQKRAELVRDILVSAGIDQSRIEVMAFGDTRLRYGRADRRNRRAAIVIK